MNLEFEASSLKSENKDSSTRKSSESSSSTNSGSFVVLDEKPLVSPVLGSNLVSEVDLQDAIAIAQLHDCTGVMINSPSTPNVVGKSIFYDCLNDPSPLNENLSFQKSDTDDDGKTIIVTPRITQIDEVLLLDAATYEIDQEYKNDGNFTIFGNILYLGSANIQLPKSESEILRQINELNTSSGHAGVKVKISIPNCCDGQVMLVFFNFLAYCLFSI